MSENQILLICLLLAVIGLIVVAGIMWFGFTISRNSDKNKYFPHPLWDEFLHHMYKRGPGHFDEIPRLVHDSYTEYLQRRNEFWTAYGQVILAVLIVVVLSILLVTGTISAEAGLPILSGISGFAIAKGVSAAKSGMSPSPRGPNDRG